MATATKRRPKPEPEEPPQPIAKACMFVGIPCAVAAVAVWFGELPEHEMVGANWWPFAVIGVTSLWYLRVTRATAEDEAPAPKAEPKKPAVEKIEVELVETAQGRLVRKSGGDGDTNEFKRSDFR